MVKATQLSLPKVLTIINLSMKVIQSKLSILQKIQKLLNYTVNIKEENKVLLLTVVWKDWGFRLNLKIICI